MLLIPAFGRERQVNLCEFKDSVVYRVSSSTASAVTQRNLVFKRKTKQTNKKTFNCVCVFVCEREFEFVHALMSLELKPQVVVSHLT